MALETIRLQADIIDSTDTVVDTVTIGRLIQAATDGVWRVDEYTYNVDTSGFGGTPPYYLRTEVRMNNPLGVVQVDSVENPFALGQIEFGGTTKVGFVPGVSSASGKFLKDDGTWDTPGGLIGYKAADETVNNSNTYQDDNHITGISLEPDSLYAIKGYLLLTTPTGADFKMQLVFSQSTQEFRIFALAGSGDLDDDDENSGALVFLNTGHSLGGSLWVDGLVWTNASNGGTVKLQWAQVSATASDTILGKGSYLSFTKLA